MAKGKILDPIHAFVRYNDLEREVISSWAMQRLRYIHQNSLAYLVYPGATHSRFEHSLGVMELAGRAYDTITATENRFPASEAIFPDEEQIKYWRQVIRLAALCHDMGHLPFSHAAEEEILPPGVCHETFTKQAIRSEEMQGIFSRVNGKINSEDIVKLAVGQKQTNQVFTPWEKLLSEVITGDVFGVDRMDYLLRDSYYCGVAYGRFDHYRLIDTLRALPCTEDAKAITLGVEEGGLRSAEDLLLSRYFMFKQVYFHSVGRMYSIHLSDFLKTWIAQNPKLTLEVFRMTDHEVLAEVSKAAKDPSHPGYESADCILRRKHYKLLYQPTPAWVEKGVTAQAVAEMAKREFGEDAVRYDVGEKTDSVRHFPVLTQTGSIESGVQLSPILPSLPSVEAEYVFIRRPLATQARTWLKKSLMVKNEFFQNL